MPDRFDVTRSSQWTRLTWDWPAVHKGTAEPSLHLAATSLKDCDPAQKTLFDFFFAKRALNRSTATAWRTNNQHLRILADHLFRDRNNAPAVHEPLKVPSQTPSNRLRALSQSMAAFRRVSGHAEFLIELLSETDDRSRIAEIAESLVALSDQRPRSFRGELARAAEDLVSRKRPGAAAALEVCGRLGIGASFPAFLLALRTLPSDDLTLAVAAQRLRQIPIPTSETPDLLVDLERHVRTWVRQGPEDYARDAFLSLSIFRGPRSFELLREVVVRNRSAVLVEAAAQALIPALQRDELSKEIADVLLSEVIRRQADNNLEGTSANRLLADARLVELLGFVARRATTSSQAIQRFSALLSRGTNTEKAAAVRGLVHFCRTHEGASSANVAALISELGRDGALGILIANLIQR